MHVAEELFRSIRMSELEYSNLLAAFEELVAEEQIEVASYPIIDRFLSALGYTAGRHDDGEVYREIELTEEEE